MKKYIIGILLLTASLLYAAPKYYVDNDGYIHTPGFVTTSRSDNAARYA